MAFIKELAGNCGKLSVRPIRTKHRKVESVKLFGNHVKSIQQIRKKSNRRKQNLLKINRGNKFYYRINGKPNVPGDKT